MNKDDFGTVTEVPMSAIKKMLWLCLDNVICIRIISSLASR